MGGGYTTIVVSYPTLAAAYQGLDTLNGMGYIVVTGETGVITNAYVLGPGQTAGVGATTGTLAPTPTSTPPTTGTPAPTPMATPPTTPTPETSQVGLIIGISGAAVFVVGLVVWGVFAARARKQTATPQQGTTDPLKGVRI